jgi:hypothetical protein
LRRGRKWKMPLLLRQGQTSGPLRSTFAVVARKEVGRDHVFLGVARLVGGRSLQAAAFGPLNVQLTSTLSSTHHRELCSTTRRRGQRCSTDPDVQVNTMKTDNAPKWMPKRCRPQAIAAVERLRLDHGLSMRGSLVSKTLGQIPQVRPSKGA